jgi:hypothetical protein
VPRFPQEKADRKLGPVLMFTPIKLGRRPRAPHLQRAVRAVWCMARLREKICPRPLAPG